MRSFRFEGFVFKGHQVGGASVVIHAAGCQGVKGGAKTQIWLFKTHNSTVAKIAHNSYLHPHANHSGLFSLPPVAAALLEEHASRHNWEAATKLIQSWLVVVYGRRPKARLKHFPAISTPDGGGKGVIRRAPPKPLATRFVQGFTVDGKVLGPYFIDLHEASKTFCDVRLRGGNHTAVAWRDGVAQTNLHPHTNGDGMLDISPIAPELGAIAPASPHEALFYIEAYLRTGISNGDAYLKLQYWPDVTAP